MRTLHLEANTIPTCLNGSLKQKLAAVAGFGTGVVAAGFTFQLSCLQLKKGSSEKLETIQRRPWEACQAWEDMSYWEIQNSVWFTE